METLILERLKKLRVETERFLRVAGWTHERRRNKSAALTLRGRITDAPDIFTGLPALDAQDRLTPIRTLCCGDNAKPLAAPGWMAQDENIAVSGRLVGQADLATMPVDGQGG